MRALVLMTVVGLSAASLAAAPIRGLVQARQGEELAPLRKAEVVLYSSKDREIIAATKTDADGRFLLDAPAGVFQLQARRSGYISSQRRDTLRADCRQACGPFELELMRGAVLSGHTLDELGEPLEGVSISAVLESETAESAAGGDRRGRSSRRSRNSSARSDDRGFFRLASLAPGAYNIKAVAATRGPTNDIAKASLEGVDLAAGEERDLVLTVRPERYDRFRMSGRVVLDDVEEDRDGTRLFVRMVDGASELRRFSTRSETIGPDGAFELDDLPAGRYSAQFSGRRGGRSFGKSRSLGIIDLNRDLTGLLLEPIAPSGVAGKIRIEAEDPPSRVTLWLRAVEPYGDQMIPAAMPEFSFRNNQFLPGEYHVMSRQPEFFVVEASSAGKPLPSGKIRIVEGEIHDLQVLVSDQTATVTGSLRRGEAAAANVDVRLKDGRGERSSLTDQYGRFAFDHVRPGNVVIRAESLQREFPAAAGAETDVDLTLEP